MIGQLKLCSTKNITEDANITPGKKQHTWEEKESKIVVHLGHSSSSIITIHAKANEPDGKVKAVGSISNTIDLKTFKYLWIQ